MGFADPETKRFRGIPRGSSDTMPGVAATVSASEYPIVAALIAAEEFLGGDRLWQPVNATQERFLAGFASGRAEASRIGEIESIASRDADELNKFLRRRGFPPGFRPFAERRFGAASVLDLLAEWKHEGAIVETITPDGRRFPGVHIGADGVRFFSARRHRSPIACLETKSGDEVFLTMLDEPPGGPDLLGRAHELSRRRRDNHDFAGLVFPMVGLDQQVGLGWLVGMVTEDEEGMAWEIDAATQRNRLRMNEVGARAESAVTVQVLAAGIRWKPKPDHVIDRPFLVWFERDGLERPLFVAYVAEEDWRNPGGLGR